MIVRTVKIAVRALLSVITALGLYALAWVILPNQVIEPLEPFDGPIPVGIVHNGNHADLLLPTVAAGIDLRTIFPPSAFPHADPNPVAVTIGWGHKDFYLNTPTWADLDPLVGLQALTAIGDTALHVAYWPFRPDFGDQSAFIFVGEAHYRALVMEIEASLTGPKPARRIEAPGYGDWDAFFEARGRYHAFHTCNSWVARRLQRAGLPAPFWTPGPEALLQAFRSAVES